MKKILTIFLLFFAVLTFTPSEILATCGNTRVDSETRAVSCYDSANELITGFSRCTNNQAICCSDAEACDNFFNIVDGPKGEYFDSINPLKTHGDSTITADLSTPGGIVSRLLQFLFPIAALILFVMLVWGGFEILSKSTAGTKGMEAGKNRITAAIVGFLLLFATYWMAQIIEVIFGIIIV